MTPPHITEIKRPRPQGTRSLSLLHPAFLAGLRISPFCGEILHSWYHPNSLPMPSAAFASAQIAAPRPAITGAGLTLCPSNGGLSGLAYWGNCFTRFSLAALRPFSVGPRRRLSAWARLSVAPENHVLVLFTANDATSHRL